MSRKINPAFVKAASNLTKAPTQLNIKTTKPVLIKDEMPWEDRVAAEETNRKAKMEQQRLSRLALTTISRDGWRDLPAFVKQK